MAVFENSYISIKRLFVALFSQFSSHLNNCLIPCDKVGIGNILITISDSSSTHVLEVVSLINHK